MVNDQLLDLDGIHSEEELVDRIYKIVRQLGFSAALFSYTPVGWLPSNDPGVVKQAISIHLKSEIIDSWLQHHNLKPSLSHSPMSHYFDVFRKEMINRVRPKMFSIAEMLANGYESRSSAGDRWLRRIQSMGVDQLFSVPHFSVRSEYWSLGLFRYREDSSDTPPTARQVAELQFLVAQLAEFSITHLGWRNVSAQSIERPLTKRELECIYWASKGMTAEETSTELGLGLETVRKYLKNACLKLGAPNKVAAVSIAHQLGLIGYTLG